MCIVPRLCKYKYICTYTVQWPVLVLTCFYGKYNTCVVNTSTYVLVVSLIYMCMCLLSRNTIVHTYINIAIVAAQLLSSGPQIF